MMKTKKIFFNKAQQYIIHISARILFVIASRRFGKSEGGIMPILLRNVQQMPRGQHAIVATTYKQALTRTLPGTIHALQRLGYREREHFWVGRKAPASSHFAEPYIKPEIWDHYIHWYNGSVNPIISQDIPFSSNSLTLSSIIADEAKTLKHAKLIDETLPAITPLAYYKDCPWDGSQTYVSDMPTKKSEMWLLKKAKDMNPEIIALIEGLLIELYNLKSKNTGSLHYRKRIATLEKEIAFYRKQAILFVKFSILDNLEVVSETYIKDRYRDLPLSKFLTSIMSYELKVTEGGFYAAMSEKHYYNAYDNSFLQNFRKDDGSLDYETAAKTTFDCSQDTDINKSKPLYIAADTNINVNWITVGQPDYTKGKLRTLKSFYVKHPKMMQELCEEFAEYYKPLPLKKINFYFDHTFLQGRSATNAESFYETIVRVLTAKGFHVNPIYIGQAMRHDEKHKEIDAGFKGQKNLLPTFNKPNNEALVTALEKTTTTVGRNGWGKDKSGEKEEDSDENPIEHRTDATDSFDTLYIGCNFFRADYLGTGISNRIVI